MKKSNSPEFQVEAKREIKVAQVHQSAGIPGVMAPQKTITSTDKVKFYWNGRDVEWVAGERSGVMPSPNFYFMEFAD